MAKVAAARQAGAVPVIIPVPNWWERFRTVAGFQVTSAGHILEACDQALMPGETGAITEARRPVVPVSAAGEPSRARE